MSTIWECPPSRKRVDRFARADKQSIKQQEDKWWRCGGVMIFCNWLYEVIKACRSGCNVSLRRWYRTHTTDLLENDTYLRKQLVSVMRQQKFCNVAENTKSHDNARSKKIPAKKNAKPPIQQERTKTQNCTKVADTTKK